MRVLVLGLKQIIWQGRTKEVVLPTDDGEMCVLDFHQPFLVKLNKGDIRLGAGVSKVPIAEGIARMLGNELTILAGQDPVLK